MEQVLQVGAGLSGARQVLQVGACLAAVGRSCLMVACLVEGAGLACGRGGLSHEEDLVVYHI